ncbi:hydroxyacylglutathione hydrolase [Sulfitobacter sp. S190]|uniref:hydroxyacylglutathione hydrolase n=1 Tax=Sulfitobacter sp. S190 TaxID=2867022 RepID=UPI0021A89FFA|nr:hydroxyacylglutathione hydrolase [Sulfitobacter sp. S190]UWR23120.1 hydroxyacylglutathione hydrolase [Sulfitobacter sp. S190]
MSESIHSETITIGDFDLVTVPCLSDNYAFLLHHRPSGETALVDVPEAGPIMAELRERDWPLNQIWLTHHHFDHVDGLETLAEAYPAPVYGAEADAARLPPLDHKIADGGQFDFAGATVDVWDVSGHTIGHIAFYVADAKAAFTADSLMALGCGRLFEGTPDQMWTSLQKLRGLPADTWICSGHEYTASNAKFALSVCPDNAELVKRATEITRLRQEGRFTVPSLLSLESATNPFLRPEDAAIRATLDMADASDTAVFAEIRSRKDSF